MPLTVFSSREHDSPSTSNVHPMVIRLKAIIFQRKAHVSTSTLSDLISVEVKNYMEVM